MENSLPKINIDLTVLSDVDKALKTEWLVTNGLGGYASSSILGVNTRKYHGLLIAALNLPVDRRVLLTKLDEEIVVGTSTYSFGADETELGIIKPEGYKHLCEFSIAPLPTFTYATDEHLWLKKTVFMPFGKNATVIIYEASNTNRDAALIRITPFVNFRHFQAVTGKNVPWKFIQKAFGKRLIVQPTISSSTLILCSTEGHYRVDQEDWAQTYFRVDASRGESCVDYNFKPGYFEFFIAPNQTKKFSIMAASGKNEEEASTLLSFIYKDSAHLEVLHNEELKRRSTLLNNFHKKYSDVPFEDYLKWLILATDTFIVHRKSTKTKSIIAGYHWFEDWGRDALISLPGLTLITGRFEDAKQILLTFQQYCREGIVPNRFPDIDGDKPAYNTVDATLWYFNAVLQYLKYTGNFDFVQKMLWETLQSIIKHHVKGTLFNIRMDQDGLIRHGPQLTWMDTAVAGVPVTPREGKAVEIQALWYNALKIMQLLATRFGQNEKARLYVSMANETKKSFVEKFWIQQKNYLYDVVNDNLKDYSLRPNQIIAVSLDFTMLDKDMAENIVNTVWEKLWTVFGLRTLSNDDSRYTGKYSGNLAQRDQAYHNGTVWPWLLGSFISAFLKVKNYETEWRNFAFENFLQLLYKEEILNTGLGTISEIFDGDLPHKPNGCIAQAWSVAEPLRAYVEDVLLKKPPYEHNLHTSF
jgi:predicted glycogen debranching enzyme